MDTFSKSLLRLRLLNSTQIPFFDLHQSSKSDRYTDLRRQLYIVHQHLRSVDETFGYEV